ncbi:MAG: hypothetical protein ABW022_11605 [Actinoplanes sp.]
MTILDVARPALPQSQDPCVLRDALNDPAYAPWHGEMRKSLEELERRLGDHARFGLAAE